MASQDHQLRHRTKEEEEQEQKLEQEPSNIQTKAKTRKQTRRAMAKRGLRSLSLAIALPLSLTMLDIVYFGSSRRFRTLEKPFYFPPLWALHLGCLGSAFLMGLSAWLVWADGGFHRKPIALLLYLGQLGFSLAWDPIVFGSGACRVGLVVCIGLFGALVGCSRMFRNVNPIAGDLVKPCLLSALLLAITNVRLVLQ